MVIHKHKSVDTRMFDFDLLIAFLADCLVEQFVNQVII